MKEKYHKVFLRRMEPAQYIKHLQSLAVSTYAITGNYFYDQQYDHSEIYSGQITSGFWVLSLKTEEKADTCYVYQPKNSKSSYYSINYYEARSAVGYQDGEEIKWTKNLAVFSGPSTTFHIYVRKRTPVMCYRLIFSHSFLIRLLDFSASGLPAFLTNDFAGNVNEGFIRGTANIESMALHKLQHILRNAGSDFNNHLSLTACAFEITNLFFRCSVPDNQVARVSKTDEELMARVVTELEAQIQNKFPGINALAASFYISPSKLKDSFKTIYQITPLVYFRKLQMAYALDVLKRNELTVKELANMLGFKKPSTFSVWFKRYTGKLPHEI